MMNFTLNSLPKSVHNVDTENVEQFSFLYSTGACIGFLHVLLLQHCTFWDEYFHKISSCFNSCCFVWFHVVLFIDSNLPVVLDYNRRRLPRFTTSLLPSTTRCFHCTMYLYFEGNS